MNSLKINISSRVKNVMLSSTARDSSYMLIGNMVATFLGYLLIIILTRNLTTSAFGLIVTAMSFTQLATDVIELGINSATINFVSSSPDKAKPSYLKVVLTLKLGIAFGAALMVYIFSPLISSAIFKSAAILPYIQISAIGIFLFTVIISGTVIFQAKKQFLIASILNCGINIVRLGIALVLLSIGLFYAADVYLAINVALIILVIIIFGKLGLKVFQAKSEPGTYKQIFRFGLPVGGGMALAAVYSRLDQILIFNIAGEEQAGFYGLAFRVASVLIFASAALGAAISPRFATMAGKDFIRYFKKTLLASLGLVLVGVLSIPLAPFVLPLIFGQKFATSVTPYQILALGMIFFVITSPFNAAILYQYKKTRFNLYSGIFVLILIWLTLSMLVPKYQSAGAALAITLVYSLQMVVTIGYFLILAKQLKATSSPKMQVSI